MNQIFVFFNHFPHSLSGQTEISSAAQIMENKETRQRPNLFLGKNLQQPSDKNKMVLTLQHSSYQVQY